MQRNEVSSYFIRYCNTIRFGSVSTVPQINLIPILLDESELIGSNIIITSQVKNKDRLTLLATINHIYYCYVRANT